MSGVISEDSPENGRRYSPLFKACALAAIFILFFGGGWAAIGPAGRPGSGPVGAEIEIAALSRRLLPSIVATEGNEDAARAAEDLVHAARIDGLDPRELLSDALPEAHEILGMLSLDRDIDDFLDYASREDAVGTYYREEARVSLAMRPLRSRYEAAFAAAFAALSGGAAGKDEELSAGGRKRPYVATPQEVWLPPRNELALSHPYALDVFFQHVDKSGEAERGPLIRALKPGIVVAAAYDWSGGPGLSAYAGGGLSPASGNGLVVYDPASRLYCSYFHLSSVALKKGAVIGAGTIVGRGGNSGMNARKKNHGEHLHIEIFDAARDAPLSSYQILELLKK
jgi:murein DD-endopeptidase MepM/ murein hydrolase activator NlpD